MNNYLPVFITPQGEAAVQQAYRAVLSRWTAPYNDLYVPTSFGDVHVIASGPESAPPLVLLHAYFATAAVWYPNAGALSERYRVYAVDILGEANLSRPTRPINSLDEFLACFSELLDGLQVHKPVLIGNSFGGFLAASWAMSQPQRTGGLVFIGPAATFHTITPFYLHIFLPKVINLMLPFIPGPARRARKAIDWMYAGLPPDDCWDELFFQVMLHGTATNRIFPRVYSPTDFEKIKEVPALFLAGDHEKIYKPEPTLRQAKQLLPHLETELIPNAHHITALANPQAVNQRILGFLQGHKIAKT